MQCKDQYPYFIGASPRKQQYHELSSRRKLKCIDCQKRWAYLACRVLQVKSYQSGNRLLLLGNEHLLKQMMVLNDKSRKEKRIARRSAACVRKKRKQERKVRMRLTLT